MKGIILAGGMGGRFSPVTISVSKQLLPIYDKPMVYYPLSTLMLAGIRDVLIISTPRDISHFSQLFGDGSRLGMNIQYKIQQSPRGIAEAFIIGEDFIGTDSVCLVLGDNVFYGNGLENLLGSAVKLNKGARVFGYRIDNPCAYGVPEFDADGRVLSIEEKPQHPKSDYAVTGLYFYDSRVVDIAKSLTPSERGEIEITDVNNAYLSLGELYVSLFDKDFVWFDAGTPKGLLDASVFVNNIQAENGAYFSCIEEIAYKKGFIGKEQLYTLGEKMKASEYGRYLMTTALKG